MEAIDEAYYIHPIRLHLLINPPFTNLRNKGYKPGYCLNKPLELGSHNYSRNSSTEKPEDSQRNRESKALSKTLRRAEYQRHGM